LAALVLAAFPSQAPGRAVDEPGNGAEVPSLADWLSTWAEVLEHEVDPGVVTDPDGRARMVATGLPWRVRDRGTGIELLLVPPGEYLRGGDADDPRTHAAQLPRHRVRIPHPMYLGRTEVTQEQWLWVTGLRPGSERDSPLLPVDSVSYLHILPFLVSTGLALPRDSEWEYACRAGDGALEPPELEAVAWHAANSGARLHTVAGKAPNAWGFHDMLGNVWELTDTPFRAFSDYPEAPILDTTADDTGSAAQRTKRGGSFDTEGRVLRPSIRRPMAPDRGERGVGFRVAKYLPEKLLAGAEPARRADQP
jgi:formylglycine-generating enzyme required for sulfatase activity